MTNRKAATQEADSPLQALRNLLRAFFSDAKRAAFEKKKTGEHSSNQAQQDDRVNDQHHAEMGSSSQASSDTNVSPAKPQQPRFRIPGLPKAPHFKGKNARQLVRENMLAAVGEFFGSATFIGLNIAGVCSCNYGIARTRGVAYPDAASAFGPADYQYVATSNGLTGLVTIWICFRISGAFFNPAISVANWMAGTCNMTRTVVLLVAQLLGGIAGTAVVIGLFPDTCNPSTTLSDNTSLAQGVFIEMFITSLLVFAALYSFRQRTKATFLSPILIGLVIFANILAAAPFTGAAQNPVRAFAPAVILGDFPSSHWVYWVGPLLGGVLGSLMYRSVNYLHKHLPSGNEFADVSGDEAEHLKEKADVVRQQRYETADGERYYNVQRVEQPQPREEKQPEPGAPAPSTADDVWPSPSQHDGKAPAPDETPSAQREYVKVHYEDANGNKIEGSESKEPQEPAGKPRQPEV